MNFDYVIKAIKAGHFDTIPYAQQKNNDAFSSRMAKVYDNQPPLPGSYYEPTEYLTQLDDWLDYVEKHPNEFSHKNLAKTGIEVHGWLHKLGTNLKGVNNPELANQFGKVATRFMKVCFGISEEKVQELMK